MTEPSARAVRVVAVVVSYNREQLLAECLRALLAQVRAVDAIVVVDNASTDGSASVTRSVAPDARLIRLQHNTGGAGGFAIGIAEAVETERADLVWVMDDDTIPTPTALDELVRSIRRAPARTVVVGSSVEWVDGRAHPMNTPRVAPFASRTAIKNASAHDCYPVRSVSFVSLLIDAAAVRRSGLPIVDYFLWNDDFEYSSRLLRRGLGFVSRRSVVVHKTRTFGSTDADPGDRFRFEVRNKVWLLTRSNALSIPEKFVYAGSTLVRWMKTFARSRDRSRLTRGFVKGLGESLRRAPVPNVEALRRLGVTSTAVATIEETAARST